MVAIAGDVPAKTPVASARRTWNNTAILWLLGFLTFVTVSLYPAPRPGEVNEGREQFHRPEPPPPIGWTDPSGNAVTDPSGNQWTMP
jgi:hypothetical protein